MVKRKGGAPRTIEERLEQVDRQQRVIIDRLERIVWGLDWMLDPMPAELPDEEQFPPVPADYQAEVADPGGRDQDLIDSRTNPYRAGLRASEEGEDRESNPYKEPRGGNQRAWWLGYDDGEQGLDRSRGPRR